jgi:hypothetical protein
MYERAIIMLDKYAVAAPRLAHAIGATRGALVEYMRKSRKSRMYALAMSPCALYHATLMLTLVFIPVLNPTIKFKWIEDHWNTEEVAAATRWIREAVSACPPTTRARSS